MKYTLARTLHYVGELCYIFPVEVLRRTSLRIIASFIRFNCSDGTSGMPSRRALFVIIESEISETDVIVKTEILDPSGAPSLVRRFPPASLLFRRAKFGLFKCALARGKREGESGWATEFNIKEYCNSDFVFRETAKLYEFYRATSSSRFEFKV